MEVYAAMVDRMDQGIGRIIDVLEKNGELDNTLAVYLQDNGGCAEGYGRASNSDKKDRFAFKPFGPDDLQTKIWPPMQTRDGRCSGTGPETMPGAEDTFVAYGLGWANVSNTPFRGYKHDGYEGGISTPFIVHWPAGAEAQIGRVRTYPSDRYHAHRAASCRWGLSRPTLGSPFSRWRVKVSSHYWLGNGLNASCLGV